MNKEKDNSDAKNKEKIDQGKSTLDFQAQAMKFAQDLAVMYQRQMEHFQELKKTHATLRSIVDGMSEALLVIDQDLTVLEANRKMCQLCNHSKDEILNLKAIDIFPRELTDICKQKADEPWQRNFNFDLDLDGSGKRSYAVGITSLPEHALVIIILHDNTAEQRAQNTKAEFFSLVSHELRTPLNGIVGYAELLQQELVSQSADVESGQEFTAHIIQEAVKLNNLVSKIVKFAQLLSIENCSTFYPFNLIGTLETVLDNLKAAADSLQMTFHRRGNWKGLTIWSNETLLAEMFTELIQNCIDHGDEGGNIFIEIQSHPTVERRVLVSISDDGPGIPGAHLDKVFDTFYQVEDHRTRTKSGLGLGLPLARKIGKLLGATLRLNSRVDEGTTVVVDLPINAMEEFSRKVVRQ